MLVLKVSGIIVQAIIGTYAIYKSYKAAAADNISFTVHYSTLWVTCVIGIWNCF